MLKEKLQNDLKKASREKNELALQVLRMLQGAIINKEKEKRYKINQQESSLSVKDLEEKSRLDEKEITEVILSEIKKRKESIIGFEKGKRESMAQQEKKELEILQKYLPEQLPEEEIRKLASEAIKKVSGRELKDMGKVMAELMPKVKGRAEGGTVNKIVKELLTS